MMMGGGRTLSLDKTQYRRKNRCRRAGVIRDHAAPASMQHSIYIPVSVFRKMHDIHYCLHITYHAQLLRVVTGRELSVERWARLPEK